MASAGAGGRTSVRQHLWMLLAANLVVLCALGVGGIVASLRAHDSIHFLAGKVEPATQANSAAMQYLTESESFVWAWGISGDPKMAADYTKAIARFHSNAQALEKVSKLDPQVALLVADFELAANDWITAYADERLHSPTGPASFDEDVYQRGERLFEGVRTTNEAVASRLRELSDQADAQASRRLRRILTILAAALLAGAALSLLYGERTRRRVTIPLGELEATAHRLALGEHDARAPVSGPREVLQVATAINRMADENDRARAVEARVVEQLRALDAVKSDFVSNVSHELRTPLTSILGYLELLEEELRGHAHDTETEMIEAAKRNVLRLGELIDDLLALTRSEAKRTELVPIDLGLLARDVVTDLRVASSQQGVEISLDLPSTAVPILGDASQMARVITNLVSNAVKFSHGGSAVEVTLVLDGDDALLSVEDHGIGIPAAEMNQLGSRFYRASNAVGMGITGTGLGLRIVQAIVENHHGSVDLRSTQGAGTTVWVRIPIARAKETAAEADPAVLDAALPADPATSSGAVG